MLLPYSSRKSSGFTYIELLVVVVILGILMVGMSNLFFSVIRGGGKVDVGTEIKQNGQQALANMETLIRNSDSVSSCSPIPGQSIVLTGKDGGTTTLLCDLTNPATGYIASNSARLTSTKAVVTDCTFTCDTTVGKAPLVGIIFTVTQAGQPGGSYQQATAKFSTSVVVRKYQ